MQCESLCVKIRLKWKCLQESSILTNCARVQITMWRSFIRLAPAKCFHGILCQQNRWIGWVERPLIESFSLLDISLTFFFLGQWQWHSYLDAGIMHEMIGCLRLGTKRNYRYCICLICLLKKCSQTNRQMDVEMVGQTEIYKEKDGQTNI
jgi:hypothetical protein